MLCLGGGLAPVSFKTKTVTEIICYGTSDGEATLLLDGGRDDKQVSSVEAYFPSIISPFRQGTRASHWVAAFTPKPLNEITCSAS